MVGRRNLKMVKQKSGDVDDLTPPVGEDLPALRTTHFQGGEDDEGTPLKVGTLGQSTICKSKVVSTKACVPLVLAKPITCQFL